MSERCKAKVYKPGMAFGFRNQCKRAAKRDGYCTQHHPDARAARNDAAWERVNAKIAANDRRREADRKRDLRAAHHIELVALLGLLANSSYDVPAYEIRQAYERGRELLP